jgi:pyruvate/2-oxoglutarate dehydrogenase complex dihydrolipoamide dehydrogenase (E3) component
VDQGWSLARECGTLATIRPMDTTPSNLEVDLLVIGYGKGGKTLAAQLGLLGRRVVMVEQSDRMYGGTCVNIGCVPTKALVHEAEMRRGDDDPRRWYTDAVGKVDALTTRLRGINFAMLDTIDCVTVITGRAVFTDAHTVEISVGGDRLTVRAKAIVIGTGSEPVVPDIAGLRDSSCVVTSTDLIATDTLPNRLAVLGGGYLGIEFAATYRRFGSEVTVLEQGPALFAAEDGDIAEAAIGLLADEGIRMIIRARVDKVRDTGRGTVILSYEDPTGQHELEVDLILAATGRRPATRDLGLEAADIETDAWGAVVVDEHLRSSQPHVFAIGDVHGGPQFTYLSLDDSRIVADQLLGDGVRTVDDRVAVPRTVFMTPPLSTVGMTERQAVQEGHPVLVATRPVAQIVGMPRAKIVGEARGVMKFVIDANTDLILGAALLSVDSQELINTVALAIRNGVTASQLREAIYTHPSSTEAFNDVLGTVAPR